MVCDLSIPSCSQKKKTQKNPLFTKYKNPSSTKYKLIQSYFYL